MTDCHYINVKVIPNAQKTELVEKMMGAEGEEIWKIKVAAPPEKGKANQELCRYLSMLFHVPKYAVTVSQGHTSSRKIIKIMRSYGRFSEVPERNGQKPQSHKRDDGCGNHIPEK